MSDDPRKWYLVVGLIIEGCGTPAYIVAEKPSACSWAAWDKNAAEIVAAHNAGLITATRPIHADAIARGSVIPRQPSHDNVGHRDDGDLVALIECALRSIKHHERWGDTPWSASSDTSVWYARGNCILIDEVKPIFEALLNPLPISRGTVKP
jgi:hypothetical protein